MTSDKKSAAAVRQFLHILYILSVACLFGACGPEGTSFRIRGNFRDMQAGELYIYNLSDNNARLDTVAVQEGRFMYRGTAKEVTPYVLVFPNGMEQVIFVGPGEDLKYEASANDLKNYVVKGSEENDLMNRFRQETYTQPPAMVTGTARAYITDHPASPVALYLLDRYFWQADNVGGEELKRLLKVVKAKHPHNHFLLDIESQLTSEEKTQVGKTLPNVTLTRRDKSTTKLWAKPQDYNLIGFWAMWGTGGYDLLWKLRRTYDTYKEDPRLRIVLISLDGEGKRWEDTTWQDSTTRIEHYCDGLGFESKTIKALGVNEMPCYILADKKHKVLERGTDIAQLDGILKKYLQ